MNAKGFKQGAELTGWLRAPAAERFLKDLDGQVDQALTNLLGAAAGTTDPGVARRHAHWKELSDMAGLLKACRKESITEDE